MTRRKKTRKPGTLGVKSQPKSLREHERNESGKHANKSKGKAPGNRHSLVTKLRPGAQQESSAGDPRKGSKRKIPLTVADNKPPVRKPATAAKPVNPVVSYTDEQASELLEAIESDERLEVILQALDDGDSVNADDARYAEEQTALYQRLAEQLGISADSEDDNDDASDEDELEPWQKFENPKDWI